MYTSTPLSPLPFFIFFPYPISFQFLPLPFSLLSSSPLFPPCRLSLLSPSSASFPSFSPSSSSSVASLSFSPPSSLLLIILPTHFSHTNYPISNKQSTFDTTSYQISFPTKNANHTTPLCTQNRFKRPKYPLPAPTTDTTQITNYSQNGQYTGHTANPSIICVIVQNTSPLSSALHSKMASVF